MFIETRVGQAIQYINDVILQEKKGSRVNVTDIVTIITARTAKDEKLLAAESEKLRQNGALVG